MVFKNLLNKKINYTRTVFFKWALEWKGCNVNFYFMLFCLLLLQSLLHWGWHFNLKRAQKLKYHLHTEYQVLAVVYFYTEQGKIPFLIKSLVQFIRPYSITTTALLLLTDKSSPRTTGKQVNFLHGKKLIQPPSSIDTRNPKHNFLKKKSSHCWSVSSKP